MNYKIKEEGSILIFSLLMLGSMLAIGLSLTAIFLPKIKASTNLTNSVGAIYAADSAIEWCVYTNRPNRAALPQPVLSNGATYVITPSSCTIVPMNNQAVGTYKGVSRSLEVRTD